jgi:N-glycosylase/DNA lyase
MHNARLALARAGRSQKARSVSRITSFAQELNGMRDAEMLDRMGETKRRIQTKK